MIIRWICEKCNKKWIYPVEKCVYCKEPITKQKGNKIKVSGITKVLIPSLLHPIIPYNILLLEDEHGNRMPKKTMKDYKIGDNFVVEKAKTKDAVSIIKIKYDIYEAIKEVTDLINFKLDSSDEVLIKPSVIQAAYPYQAVNTNPDFLNALIIVILEMGVKKENILVAEQALIGSDVMDAAAKAGILEVCKKYGIVFADITKGPFENVESDGETFKIYKEALKRKVINAPVMKTNLQLGISGAMENLVRFSDEKTQRDMYYNNIDETLPKLVKTLDVVTIADATNGMQAQGPLSTGEPAFLNILFASRNAANLDHAFCQSFMIEIPNHVVSTAKPGFEVVGNEIDALKYQIKIANTHETPHPDIKLIDGKACPACLNLMYNLTSKLVGLRGHEISILMGSMINENIFKNKERIVVLGDCAYKKLQELNIKHSAIIDKKTDFIEQLVLLKKLLMTQGAPKITPVDKVKSKMKKLLSKVVS